eukprot:PITA_25433
MGSSLKIKALKDLLIQEQPDIFLIQETKSTEQDFTSQTQRFKNYSGISKGSDGASGGIGTLWNKNKWEISNHQLCNWWVRTDLRSKNTQEVYSIYNIYAPNHYRDKTSYWNSLEADLSSIQSCQIIIGGDMNLIRQVEEKFGGNFHPDPFRDKMETIIQLFNLIDTPLSNGKFTWSNKRAGSQNIKERFDRFLIHERLASNFQAIKSYTVHGSASDHKAVTLSLSKGTNLGPLPFKYNKYLDSHEEFCTLVQKQWAKEILGSPHYVWETKLKHLKSAIKQWARELASSERKKRSDLLSEIERWHKEKEKSQPTTDDIEKEKSMFMELYRQNRIEEEDQRLKSRCLWLKAGDKNTSFFHNNVKTRRARNQIDKIEVDGRDLHDQEEIKKAAFDHFQALLTADPQHHDSTSFLTLRKFGFSSKAVDIIRGCISDPWTAPLINGRPGNSFKSTRGLRQGCPLSPFLFIIMAETLSIHLEDLRLKREILGISIERGLKEINHSLFADDTVLIGGASSLMARRFKRVLDAFLQVSGGKLNNRK